MASAKTVTVEVRVGGNLLYHGTIKQHTHLGNTKIGYMWVDTKRGTTRHGILHEKPRQDTKVYVKALLETVENG